MNETHQVQEPREEPKKPSLFRRIYNWVLHYADTPYFVPAAMTFSFTGPWLLPIPPDILLYPLFLAKPDKIFRYAFLASTLYATGWMLGYGIGYYGYQYFGHDLLEWIAGLVGVSGPDEVIPTVKGFYDEWGIWAVMFSSATPITDKLFSFGSGILQYEMVKFVTAVLIGSFLRIMVPAVLIKIYGAPVVRFVEKYFEWVALGALILILVITLLVQAL